MPYENGFQTKKMFNCKINIILLICSAHAHTMPSKYSEYILIKCMFIASQEHVLVKLLTPNLMHDIIQ